MKVCYRCKEPKPLNQFHKNCKKPDGFQSACKSCRKQYDKDSYERDKEYHLSSNTARRHALREWSDTIKAAPCKDCHNQFHPAAMQWDHRGTDKAANVSAMVCKVMSKGKILEEIAKCDLVCANCHAIRTWKRNRNMGL